MAIIRHGGAKTQVSLGGRNDVLADTSGARPLVDRRHLGS